MRTSDPKLSGKRDIRLDSLEHVAREPMIRADFQSIQAAKDSSAMSSINKLATKKRAGWATLVHSKVVLQFINDNVMMSMAQTSLVIFDKDNARGGALSTTKTSARVGATRQAVGTGAGVLCWTTARVRGPNTQHLEMSTIFWVHA